MEVVELDGLAQLNVYIIMSGARCKSSVEFKLGRAIMERAFPPERRNSVLVQGSADMFDLAKAKLIRPALIDLTPAEVELLLRCLTEYHDNEKGGITFEAGKWYYPLVERLQEIKESAEGKEEAR